jgi:hypothetical protein
MDLMIANQSNDVKKVIKNYVQPLIFCVGKRTFTNMANFLGISHDAINRTLEQAVGLEQEISYELVQTANTHAMRKKGFLIIDDSNLSKKYSKEIEGVAKVYGCAERRSALGYCVVALCWSNGEVTIPIGFGFWILKEIAGLTYKTKVKIACGLLEEFGTKVQFTHIAMDGLYYTEEMVRFLNANEINFEARAHSTRVVEIDGTKAQLKKHKGARLRRNEHCRTVTGWWHGIKLFFTIHKRINKNGEFDVVYQVSNIETTAKEHVFIYKNRWPIEKMFRTMKQSLGLQDCCARSIEKQSAHILLTFYAYTLLQNEMFDLDLKSVEDVIRRCKYVKSIEQDLSIHAAGEIYHAIA